MAILDAQLRQQPKQELSLAITQQMCLSLEILQLPVMDLKARLDQELLENPVFQLDVETQPEVLSEAALPSVGVQSTVKDVSGNRFSVFDAADTVTWRDQLCLDLCCVVKGESARRVAHILIDYLNDNGLLDTPLMEVARQESLDPQLLANVHRALLAESPLGVGASSIQESLLLQAQGLQPRHPLVEEIISKQYNAFLQGRWREIQRALQVPISEIVTAVAHIRQLTPCPVRGLPNDEPLIPVHVDVDVFSNGGSLEIVVNQAPLPSLCINPEYSLLAQHAPYAETRTYLREKLREANLLRRAVEQRQATLHHLVTKLMSKQTSFITKGIKYAAPVTRRALAEQLGMHESTVSRAVQGKWIRTPLAVLELSRLFSEGVNGPEEQCISSQAVIERLRSVFGAAKTVAITDEAACALLAQEGIHISRRTVAKYRQRLGIPSTRQRGRWPQQYSDEVSISG